MRGIRTWDLMITTELGFVSDITAGFLWLALCIKGAIFSLNLTEDWLDFTVPRHVTWPVALM